MRRLAALALLLCAACGEQPDPQGDQLAEDLRRQLARPAVAAYLIDPQLAEAEAVTPRADLAVRILHRRDTADPDRLQLKLQITGGLEVVMLPPPEERLLQALPPGLDAAGLARAEAQLRQSRLAAAKRIPREQRTRLLPVARQMPVQVQRVAGGWNLVLPRHLERDGSAP